ncbi:MAG: peptidoglycan DD-metalloendopeptidase family protein [Acidithiobacillus caldus]|nr:peptidoglycan DD-metalloendopeptidase family protein [Acidithiobacillus caldus]
MSAVTIGGATLALNPPAFNLESIRAYFAKHRGGGDNSIYGAEIGGSGELTDVFALTERLRKSGVGYDAFQAALDDDATGLNCARGQHPDLDSDNKWDPAKIQKVYSGTVNGSTFSPVYYCQMPTASAASGAGAREQLALQCAGRVQHDAAGFDHCRDFRDIAGSNALVTPFGPEETPAAPVATGGDGAGPGAEIHFGVDLQAKPGAPVKAVYPGRVVASSPEEHRVVLEHALSDGRLAYTEYGSLDQPAVKVGQAVAPGTVLGKLGADANSPAAPRLHYAEYLAVDSTADPATGPHFLNWKSMSPHPESHTYLTAADLADPNKRMPINPDRNCIGVAHGQVKGTGGGKAREGNARLTEPVCATSTAVTAVDDDLLVKSLPNASPEARDALKTALNRALEDPRSARHFNTPTKLRMFLAQVSEETGGTLVREENLNYTPYVIKNNWGMRFTAEQALRFGRIDPKVKRDMKLLLSLANQPVSSVPKDRLGDRKLGLVIRDRLGLKTKAEIDALPNHAADQVSIAGHAYGDRYGNRPGVGVDADGWRYRGRGPIQVTFRSNYKAASETTNERLLPPGHERVDYEAQPELLMEPEHAAYASVAYWINADIGGTMDRYSSGPRATQEGLIETVTKKVNGGQINSKKRKQEWLRIGAVTDLGNC